MELPFELFIGLRYLKSKRKQAFISVISLISILGIALGVMALIIVLAVMTGFEKDLRDKILGTNSHIILLKYGTGFDNYEGIIQKLSSFPTVISASPFIYNQVMLTAEGNVSGVVVRGIDPHSRAMGDLAKNMKEGRPDLLEKKGDNDLPGVVIGKELSRNLLISLGDKVNVLSPLGISTPMGIVPKVKVFRVIGNFETGMFDYDSSLIYIGLQEAQKFFNMGRTVTGIEIKIDDIYKAKEVAERIQQQLGYPYWTKDWMQMNKNLFSALKLEKVTMFIILTLIILVAAFNIICSLIMMVMEKKREIAILRSMGATARSISKIFMVEGMAIGIVGTLLGLAGGYISCLLLEKYKFIKLDPNIYTISSLPVKMELEDVVMVILAAIGLSFFATLYPAWQASRLDPIEILRYE